MRSAGTLVLVVVVSLVMAAARETEDDTALYQRRIKAHTSEIKAHTSEIGEPCGTYSTQADCPAYCIFRSDSATCKPNTCSSHSTEKDCPSAYCIFKSKSQKCIDAPCSSFDTQEECPGTHCIFKSNSARCVDAPCGKFQTETDCPDYCIFRSNQQKCVEANACYEAVLKASPDTSVPMTEADDSSGTGRVTLIPSTGEISLSISWKIPSVSPTNPVIGIHVHDGSSHENGAILVGFCGGPTLPTFSEKCEQSTSVHQYVVGGQACNLGASPPCPNTNTDNTVMQALEKIKDTTPAQNNFYLNVHTQYSFNKTKHKDGGALGLIRGQLKEVPCTN